MYFRTYTGLQTLGMETVCEIELDESSLELQIEDILGSHIKHISSTENKVDVVPKKLDFSEAALTPCKPEEVKLPLVDDSIRELATEIPANESKQVVENGETISDNSINDINLKERLTRKRRKTIESVIPIKKLHSAIGPDNEVTINGKHLLKDSPLPVLDKDLIISPKETLKDIPEIENITEEHSPDMVEDIKTENVNPVDVSSSPPEIEKSNKSSSPGVLNNCIGPFQKVYLKEKSNGAFINVIGNAKINTQKSPPTQLEIGGRIIPTSLSPKSNGDKTVYSIISNDNNLQHKINVGQNLQKVVIISKSPKILQNGNAPSTIQLNSSTFKPTIISSKTPVRIFPNNKNITINFKNMQSNGTDFPKRRSLSVDGASPSTNNLQTVLLSPEKLNVIKQSYTDIKKEPVHVILNSTADRTTANKVTSIQNLNIETIFLTLLDSLQA